MSVCKSSNTGVTWKRSQLSTSRGAVYTLVIDPTNSNHILAGGYYHNGTNRVGKLFKSTDGGDNWTDSSTGLEIRYNYVYSLTFHPKSPNTIYAGCRDGIFRSTDGAASWTKLNTGCYNINAIIFDMDSPNILYAASNYDGIYTSSDNGLTWSEMNDGLTNEEIECMALDPTHKILYAGTSGAGLFRYDLSTKIDPLGGDEKLPVQFTLKPNYPNPFNPKTTIQYEIPVNNASLVHLKIYNISGQIVKTLVDEYQPAGEYTIVWDGTDDAGKPMSSGIYFCNLKAGNHRSIQKMTLIR